MEKSIYNKISRTSSEWIDNTILKKVIETGLSNYSTGIQPVRTRKKLFKIKVCEILGYQVPKSFSRKIKPDFPMYDFDLYIQQSNNLQIWYQDVDPQRRYVIIKVDEEGKTLAVRVIDGNDLSIYDTTGKLTTKLQAKLNITDIKTKLVVNTDTEHLNQLVQENSLNIKEFPYSNPKENELIPIEEIFEKLSSITNGSYDFKDPQTDRKRGDTIHHTCSRLLGYINTGDNGQFPDIKNQLLEIKLQTSPTIDIGLENPASDIVNEAISNDLGIRNKDVRYAVIYAIIENNMVKIKHLIVVNGENFYSIFPQMQGNVVNSKIQLPLPSDFFN